MVDRIQRSKAWRGSPRVYEDRKQVLLSAHCAGLRLAEDQRGAQPAQVDGGVTRSCGNCGLTKQRETSAPAAVSSDVPPSRIRTTSPRSRPRSRRRPVEHLMRLRPELCARSLMRPRPSAFFTDQHHGRFPQASAATPEHAQVGKIPSRARCAHLNARAVASRLHAAIRARLRTRLISRFGGRTHVDRRPSA